MTAPRHRLRWARRPRVVRRPPGGERGAILVEFALVSLILLTLLAGAFDYGRAWRVGLAANEAARTGARVGSGQGDKLTADFSLLSGMKAALDSSGQLEEVTRVVIFRSDNVNGDVPPTCVTANGTGDVKCNILTGEQFRDLPATSAGALGDTGCISESTTKGYCPTTRKNLQVSAEYLGVWVQVRYDFMFPIFGSSQMVERQVVMRLEPKDS